MWNQRETYRDANKIKEPTGDGQAYEHNVMFEERRDNKHENITVVSLLFINLVIHCHRLALHLMSSQQWHHVTIYGKWNIKLGLC